MERYERIVDLTLPLVPGQGGRPLTIERGRTEELTPHEPVDHPWYIMHRVQTISHIGTHIEALPLPAGRARPRRHPHREVGRGGGRARPA